MTDQQLRLKATVQNEASAEIRRLARDVGTVKKSSGMTALSKWFGEFSGASDQAAKAVRPLSTGLSTIGVSGLAAGLSITGLVSQFRDLAKAVPALQELSRQSGMSRTEIERLKYAAANLNVDPSKMSGAIASFSEQMVQFRHHTGALYAEMARGSQGLANKIAAEDPAAGFKDMAGWLARIPDAAQRAGKSVADSVQIQRHYTQEAFGDADMAQIFAKGPQGFADAYAEAAKNVKPITDELVAQSEAFNQAINRFDNSWNNLKNDLGTSILPGLTAATEGLRKVFDMVKAEPALAATAAGGLGAVLLRRRIMSGSTLAGGAGLNRAAGDLTGAAGALKGAAAALERGGGRGPGGPNAPTEPEKPGATSFDKGRALLATAGLAGVVANAPGMDEAGNKERDANASALTNFGNALGYGTITKAREAVLEWWKGDGSSAAFHPEDDRETRARGGFSRATNSDGNVLHRNDEMPAGVSARDLLATTKEGTKSGVLAGFRELLAQQELDGSSGAGGGAANLRYGRSAGGGYRASPGSGGGMPLGQGAKGGSFAGTGANAALAKESYDFWRSKGLDHNAALSMVSQEQGESGFNVRSRGDYVNGVATAHGIFQWHGDRREAIKAGTGIDVDNADHKQQLEAAYYEGTKGMRAGFLNNLNGRTLGDAVFQGVHRFEGSADQVGDTAKRLRMAQGWDGGGSFLDKAPGGSTPVPATIGAHIADMKANGLLTDEQCVTLAMGTVGVRKGSGAAGGNVHDWLKGVDADQGTLVPGTPVATFLNRDGSEADRYAGGGSGTPGAGLDHAGVFQSYILDAAGKRVGMKMAEQFAGSGGVHMRDYLFGKGAGEHNGSAYHAVLGPDGQPLGGASNPFTTAEALRKSIRPVPTPAPEPVAAPAATPQGQMQGELHIHLRDGQKPRMVAVNKNNLNMRLSSGPTMVATA